MVLDSGRITEHDSPTIVSSLTTSQPSTPWPRTLDWLNNNYVCCSKNQLCRNQHAVTVSNLYVLCTCVMAIANHVTITRERSFSYSLQIHESNTREHYKHKYMNADEQQEFIKNFMNYGYIDIIQL